MWAWKIVTSVQPGLARTVVHVRRSQGPGALSVVAGLVIREELVKAPVRGVLLEFAMRDVAKIWRKMVLGVYAQQVTLGRGVKKVCYMSTIVC